MQDIPNLKRKLIKYEGIILTALITGDHYTVNYYSSEIERIKERLKRKEYNKKKNKKAYKKAHGL